MLEVLIAKARMLFNPLMAVSYDTYALSLLAPLRQEYLPWTKSAIRPAALCNILNEIVINDRRNIVEFGAGLSTIYMAKVLSASAGTLLSFDDDEGWAAKINGILAELGLSAAAQVVYAPLTPTDAALGGGDWYDRAVLNAALGERSVDLVLVDGPKALTKETAMARFPAVPFIKERLGPTWSVFLDDINRPSERRIFAQWEKILGVRGEVHLLDGGFGLLNKGRRFYSRM